MRVEQTLSPPAPARPGADARATPRTRGLAASSGLYFAARLGTGVVGLAALVVYTRFLSAAEYGVYAMAVAGTGLWHAVLFNWLSLGLARFLPGAADRERVLGAARSIFVGQAALSAAGAAAAWWLWPDPALRALLPLALLLLWSHAWFELNLEVARSDLAAGRYALVSLGKAVLSVAVGLALVMRGWGAGGLIAASVAATAVAGLVLGGGAWFRAGRARPDWGVAREMAVYGLPLSAALTASFVIDSSDRFLLGTLVSPAAAGEYSASYLLAKQAILLLMAPVALANFPVAVRALASEGPEGARRALAQSGVLLVGLGVPGTLGFVLLAPNLAHTLLGPEFREAGRTVLPWVACAIFLFGMQQYHYGRAFTLSRRTWGLVGPAATAAGVNMALNLWWIPLWGMDGALRATLAGYVAAIALTWYLGRRHLALPVPMGACLRVCAAAAVMGAALLPLLPLRGGWALALQVAAGGLAYGAAVLALDVGGARAAVRDLAAGRSR
jgi:O-antigen/teichoic acid export membrane protein